MQQYGLLKGYIVIFLGSLFFGWLNFDAPSFFYLFNTLPAYLYLYAFAPLCLTGLGIALPIFFLSVIYGWLQLFLIFHGLVLPEILKPNFFHDLLLIIREQLWPRLWNPN